MSLNNAEEWFQSAAWKNGLELNADATTNISECHKQDHANKSVWDQAFAFLKDQDFESLQAGKYAIDGDNVYATVAEAPNMDFDKTAWESHRRYNDIQYVIKGKERIGITTPASATVTREYDETQDISFYTAEGRLHFFQPDTFFIFFPEDLHRPGIRVDSYEPVKKVVIKIRNASYINSGK